MATFVIGFGIVLLGAAGLAVGLLARGRPLRAGCRAAGRCTGCDEHGATSGRGA